jgi:hypothetical protein
MGGVMDRRGFLAACGTIFVAASLPEPAAQVAEVDDCGGFLVPKEFDRCIIDLDKGVVFFGEPVFLRSESLTIEEVCRLRGVKYERQAETREFGAWPPHLIGIAEGDNRA